MNVSVGNYAAKFARNRDHIRLGIAKRQSTKLAKKLKSDQQKERTIEQVDNEKAEGLLYGPGIADDW